MVCPPIYAGIPSPIPVKCIMMSESQFFHGVETHNESACTATPIGMVFWLDPSFSLPKTGQVGCARFTSSNPFSSHNSASPRPCNTVVECWPQGTALEHSRLQDLHASLDQRCNGAAGDYPQECIGSQHHGRGWFCSLPGQLVHLCVHSCRCALRLWYGCLKYLAK